MELRSHCLLFGYRAALPHLQKTRGPIVNASVSGTGGDWATSPYNAAKGAVVNLPRSLALDLGKKDVRVNSVCPSLTRTGMTADMMQDEELLAKFDASFVTGANVAVDGGVSASKGQPSLA